MSWLGNQCESEQSLNGLRCFVCRKRDKDVKKFNEKTWTKCRSSLQIRRDHNFKFAEVYLPETIDDPSFGYHSRPCYSGFTAIKPNYKLEVKEITENMTTSSDSLVHDGPPQTIMPVERPNEERLRKECIFCDQTYKRRTHRRRDKLSCTKEYGSFDKVKSFATAWNDVSLLTKMCRLMQKGESIPYHRICKTNYNSKGVVQCKEQTEWHEKRFYHKRAFKKLCLFISIEVISKKRVYTIPFIRDLFLDFLVHEYKGTVDKKIFNVTHIPRQIEKHFHNKIKIINISHKPSIIKAAGVVLLPSDHTEIEDTELFQRTAIRFRDKVLRMDCDELGEKVTASDLIRGECEFPDYILDFYKTLIAGFEFRRKKSEKTLRLAKSFTSDVIHAVTEGHVKPSKQITLGSALKNITSSKKIIEVLHSYGHCCSYDILLELETQATHTIAEASNFCPSDIDKEKGLRTVTVFHNFNRSVQTATEKLTLNDTVGIVVQDCKNYVDNDNHLSFIQSLTNNTQITDSEFFDSISSSKSRKRRKSYNGFIAQIPAYSKKAKLMERMKPYNFHLLQAIPADVERSLKLDAVWVISHYYNIRTPMWVGFNAKIVKDQFQQQKVSYLAPINQSLTEKCTVLETMRRAMTVAAECNEIYGQVTYDLDIAKVAFSIQSSEKEEFKNLFIHLGGFHIKMEFFKAIGTFIQNCGLTTIMVESKLIGSGSVDSFLSGKSFSRCKSLHILVSLSLQIQEFKMFLEQKRIDLSENVVTYLQDFQNKCVENMHIKNDELSEIIMQFSKFHEETLEGRYGKTQQFYATYIQLMQYYFLFERSICSQNFELYVHVIAKINNIFFAFNHMNYARWLAWYHNTLLSIDETHPGLKGNLMIGVKRTSKAFSSIPCDLTLEQTINAYAARRLTGVMHLTNSLSARIRWSLNHAVRSAIISFVLQDSGVKYSQEMMNDLFSHRIDRSKQQIESFIECLNSRINPFTQIQSDMLLNISTSQAAPMEVSEFLLNVEQRGEELKKEFIDSCAEDEANFEKIVLKRKRILNFASCSKPMKVKSVGKIQQVALQRDLSRKLLEISSEKKIDIAEVLSYPLTAVPLSLCHLDGTIVKGDGSKLNREIEILVEEHGQSNNVDVLFIDGMFLLHKLKYIPQKFGDIAIDLLRLTTNNAAKQTYLLFDVYLTPSIKDAEYVLKNNVSEDFSITGSDQIRPYDFEAALRNHKFKEAFISFLIQHWCTDEAAKLIGNKEIYVSYKKCIQYTFDGRTVSMHYIADYICEGHEEANTKFAFFLGKIRGPLSVNIQSCDENILIILLGNMTKLDKEIKIWLELATGNNIRYLNVTKIYETLGATLCAALPAFHALTGCDYNPSFLGKGKVRSFYLLKSNNEYMDAFANISSPYNHKIIEKFVCCMYTSRKNNLKNIDEVNEARLALFTNSYDMTQDGEFERKIANYDPSKLPPCQRELQQQIARAIYISSVWNNATESRPTSLDPTQYGWLLNHDGKYNFKWFGGDELSTLAPDIILKTEHDKESEEYGEHDNDDDDQQCDEYDDDDYGVWDDDYECEYDSVMPQNDFKLDEEELHDDPMFEDCNARLSIKHTKHFSRSFRFQRP